jgi:hypothetical protein
MFALSDVRGSGDVSSFWGHDCIDNRSRLLCDVSFVQWRNLVAFDLNCSTKGRTIGDSWRRAFTENPEIAQLNGSAVQMWTKEDAKLIS